MAASPSNNVEYPPLLAPGFHTMSFDELRNLCVVSFPQSSTRQQIIAGLEQVTTALGKYSVQADVWVDGSFLTAKINPADVDIVLCIPHDVYDNGTAQQKQVIDWIRGNLKSTIQCDSYVFFLYPETHPLHWANQYMHAYWLRQFGFSRGNNFKGLAVIKVA